MRKGQKASSSSESEEKQRSKDFKDQSSPRGSSSGQDSSSDSVVEAECAMKRSQRFTCSFSFGEHHQPQSTNGNREEVSPNNSNGVSATEVVAAGLVAECVQFENSNAFCDTNKPPRSALFRPQELWLAVTRCLSLRWPPCISKQSKTKLTYQVDYDQSVDTQSSVSSESANDSSSVTSTPDDRDVKLMKNEDVELHSRVVKSCALPCRGISRSSPRLQRARQTTDLASMILEKETFLRIELIESGNMSEDSHYRAEWKLSETTKELAEGVWISTSQELKD